MGRYQALSGPSSGRSRSRWPEKRQLVEDVARLGKVKCELESEVKSLQQKFDELSSAVHKVQSNSARGKTNTIETQTTQEPSDRAEKLLHELVNVNVHNRFQVLETDNNETCGSSPVSNPGAKHREQAHKTGAKQPPIQDKTDPSPTVSPSRHNKVMPPDVLILGDSNTKAIKTDVMYPAKRVTKELTYNITQATDYIQRSTLSAPKVILFHVGTNDTRDKRDPTAVSEGFRKLIQTSHTKYPQTTEDRKLQEVGDQVNSFLKVVAEETDYVLVTDNSNMSDRGTLKEDLYRPDGYHLNSYGVRVLANPPVSPRRACGPTTGFSQHLRQKQPPRPPRLEPSPALGQDHLARAPVSSQRPLHPKTSPPSGNSQVKGQPQPGIQTPISCTSPSGSPTTSITSSAPSNDKRLTPNQPSEPCSSLPNQRLGPLNIPTSQQPGSPNFPPSRQPGPPNFPPSRQPGPPNFPPSRQPGPPNFPPSQQPGLWGSPPCQWPGPWGSPPPMFSHPPAPWSLPHPNFMPNQHPRAPPPPWPWHPAMMWPPMVW
ncbi:hypothetical protein Bbelb_144120 [Branchiostoma belcheri]|nr:hypothetical protein Bbelb_144120 [Branchiostoma belcheri]